MGGDGGRHRRHMRIKNAVLYSSSYVQSTKPFVGLGVTTGQNHCRHSPAPHTLNDTTHTVCLYCDSRGQKHCRRSSRIQHTQRHNKHCLLTLRQ